MALRSVAVPGHATHAGRPRQANSTKLTAEGGVRDLEGCLVRFSTAAVGCLDVADVVSGKFVFTDRYKSTGDGPAWRLLPP